MFRRTALSLGLATLLSAGLPSMGLAQSAPQILAEVSNRLREIRTMEADFVQLNADGSRSKGTISVHRPGRMRMDYAGKNAPLLIVGGGSISIYDGPKRKTPEVYPLQKTPLWLILRPDVDLRSGKGVRRAWTEGRHTYVHTYDPALPEAGQITFQFSGSPMMLDGWVSQTQAGEKVSVALLNPRFGMDLRPSLFSSTFENDQRAR